MIDLDNKNAVLQAQGGDKVLISIDSLPDQLRTSFNEAYTTDYPQEYKQVKNIVVSGMGGSRFPALIIHELFKEQITIPYLINDDYHLPGFINQESLVILSSYSGTTEEVVTNGKIAKEMGARITGVTAGGDVEKLLKEYHETGYVFNPVLNPSGQPRIGFGYSVGGHLGLLMKLGFLKLDKQEVDSAFENLPSLLTSCKLEIPKEANPAKQLAEKLLERYPYYLVAEHLTGVGNAVQNQTNETAKSISSSRVIPELNHHMMEGLKFPSEHAKMALFILFYSSLYSPSIQKRFSITRDVIEQNHIETVWYELKGKTKIEQAFELMGFGSYLTMYMSVLYGQDPAAIPYVDYFKAELKK